jgi:AhpD family alkylhydroperoxidase
MEARLDLISMPSIAPNIKRLSAAGHLADSVLPTATQELCRLRASQINGCGFCTDMHVKEALAAGEDAQRLHLVATWREATCFTEAERAALELTEQGTRLADAGEGVSDDVWLRARKHYDEEQLAALVFLVAMINAFNRLNVINRQPAGGYEVGQYAG